MDEDEHWTVAFRVPPDDAQISYTESAARLGELLHQVTAGRGMARMRGWADSTTSAATSPARLNIQKSAVTRIRLGSEPTVGTLQRHALTLLGRQPPTLTSAANHDTLLRHELYARPRVLIVHCARNLPDPCITYLRWLWQARESSISILIAEGRLGTRS